MGGGRGVGSGKLWEVGERIFCAERTRWRGDGGAGGSKHRGDTNKKQCVNSQIAQAASVPCTESALHGC